MNIWHFQRTVTNRLLSWAALSAAIGALTLLVRRGKTQDDQYSQGVASQFLGWAAINAGIAVIGGQGTTKRQSDLTDAYAPERMRGEANNLHRLLWLNAAPDLAYMFGGGLLVHRFQNRRAHLFARRTGSARMRGVGIGIMLQGAALFLFDVFHGLIVPDPDAAVGMTFRRAMNGTHDEIVDDVAADGI